MAQPRVSPSGRTAIEVLECPRSARIGGSVGKWSGVLGKKSPRSRRAERIRNTRLSTLVRRGIRLFLINGALSRSFLIYAGHFPNKLM